MSKYLMNDDELQAEARAKGLKLAIQVTGYTRDSRQSGNHVDDETLAIYARRFATFILTGSMV